MAQNDLLKRYLDAGMTFMTMTQARAEAIVDDLRKAGEVQAEQVQTAVNDLVERSRQNTDQLLDTIRREVREQVANLGLATTDDITRVEQGVATAAAGTPDLAPLERRLAAVESSAKGGVTSADLQKLERRLAAAESSAKGGVTTADLQKLERRLATAESSAKGGVTSADLQKLERRIDSVESSARSAAPSGPTKRAAKASQPAPAKKAAPAMADARKTPAKKAPGAKKG